MIYSVYDYVQQRYTYYEAPGAVPPHGWFRRPTPGTYMQPEELAASLPEGAVPIGSGLLPKGVIATNIPGIGTVDTASPGSGAGAGLAGGVPAVQQRVLPVFDPWESANSRGRP